MRAMGGGCLLVASVLALGCAGGLPPTHYYTLRSPSGAQPGTETGPGLAVGVESFAVDPPYDQDRIVSRASEDSTEVAFYNFHRWASPVGRLVAVALATGLRGSAGIASIEPASAIGTYDARLVGRVAYLEEVGGRETRLGLALELVAGNGETLWAEFVSGSVRGSVAGSGDAALASRFDRALEEVLGEVRSELEAVLREEEP